MLQDSNDLIQDDEIGTNLVGTATPGTDNGGAGILIAGASSSDDVTGNTFGGNTGGDVVASAGASAIDVSVPGDFGGSILGSAAGFGSVQIDGSLTATGVVKVGTLGTFSVGGAMAGLLRGFGAGTNANPTIGSVTVGGDFSGTISAVVGAALGTVTLDGTTNTGQIIENDPNNDLESLDVPNGSFTGTLSVASVVSIVVGGNLGGTVAVAGPVGSIAVNGSLTASVSVQSAGSVTVGQDLSGTVTATQSLGPVSVTAAISGVISAPAITSVSAGSVAASGEVTASQSLGALNVSGPSLGTVTAPNVSVLTASGTGTYGGTATLSATLTLQGGTPLAGQAVAFSLNVGGSTVALGSATTGQNGVATLSGVTLAGLDAGSYTGAVGVGFAGGSGVLPSSGRGNLTVMQATALLTLSGLSCVYNGTAQTATVATNPVGLSGVSVTYTMNGVPIAAPTGAGSYSVLATLNSIDYKAPPATATLTISPKPLTVTANNATKVYGSVNPAFSASYSGFVNGDTSSSLNGTLSFTTTTTTTSLVGSYPVTPGGLTSSNYTITFVPGTLTVTTLAGSIYVLDPTAGGALTLSVNAAIDTAGSLVVDSSASTAILASGNAKVTAASVLVEGSVSKSGNAVVTKTGTPGATGDPLAALVEPTPPSYGGSAVAETLSGNATATINPGLYSQINVSGNAKLTLNAGVYVIAGGGVAASGNAVLTAPGVTFIIEGGGFNQSGNAIVNGAGVTIFNAGSKYPASGGSYGAITLSGNGNLSAPATGPYAGILVFQSRDNTQALTFTGNAILGISGTIYAEAAQFVESGNAQVGSAQNPISIVVDRLTISGNGIADGLTLNAPAGTTAYTPAQIRSAYGIDSLAEDGTGQTIAIVDAYNDPNIVQALDTFDTQFGLTSTGPTLYQQYGPASSFLTVLNQYGQATSLPTTDPNGPGSDNWEVEEALDVEWAHAIAPGARIILVEAYSQSLSDLMAGVATAASQPGISVVSMSWGFPEGQSVFASDETAYDSVFTAPGVTFVASTGDYGAADPEYPAYSPNVVAVGGTSLALNADNSYNSETGWGYYSDALGASIGSGGGLSLYEPEPAYQQGVQSTGSRTTPDVSVVADPATGAWIADPYNLDPSNPFELVGGTSLSAPAWAGLLALANQGRAAAGSPSLNSTSPTEAQQALYSLPQSNYNVITSGTNGYTATSGYNLVTGLGTPVANLLVPDLVAYQGPGTTYSGPTVGPLQDANLVSTGASTGGPMDVFSVFDSFTVTSNGGAFGHDLSPGIDPPAGSAPMPAAGFPSVPTPVSLANASGGGTTLYANPCLR